MYIYVHECTENSVAITTETLKLKPYIFIGRNAGLKMKFYSAVVNTKRP